MIKPLKPLEIKNTNQKKQNQRIYNISIKDNLNVY